MLQKTSWSNWIKKKCWGTRFPVKSITRIEYLGLASHPAKFNPEIHILKQYRTVERIYTFFLSISCQSLT